MSEVGPFSGALPTRVAASRMTDKCQHHLPTVISREAATLAPALIDDSERPCGLLGDGCQTAELAVERTILTAHIWTRGRRRHSNARLK